MQGSITYALMYIYTVKNLQDLESKETWLHFQMHYNILRSLDMLLPATSLPSSGTDLGIFLVEELGLSDVFLSLGTGDATFSGAVKSMGRVANIIAYNDNTHTMYNFKTTSFST